MTRSEWLEVINARQDMYVEQLSSLLNASIIKKEINFNSPTGTGKTVMISKLINRLQSDKYFFLITTLSRGGLNIQVNNALKNLVRKNNFFVFGVGCYTSTTKLQDADILSKIPPHVQLIWIRDERHIKSNKWSKLLEERAYKIVNVSATNMQVDIQCNFTDTPLLRTPYQLYGTPKDAVQCLLKIKKIHLGVPHYNPCLIVRDVSGEITTTFLDLCKKNDLKVIDITNHNEDVQELCKNDNSFDVIINKMKITEGIDIPRANVIYIGNRPSNESTVIQLIGRVRRNALLWHKDIDIFSPQNTELLAETSKTYIYYRFDRAAVQTSDNELSMELSDTISLEQLIPDRISVKKNTLSNGYKIAELRLLDIPYTGTLELSHNEDFVTISNLPELYKTKKKVISEYSVSYKEVVQDKELVQISSDKCKFIRINDNGAWRISTTVSENIVYGKLNKFIAKKYNEELGIASLSSNVIPNACDQSNLGRLDRKGKICFSYLVKYYLKYLLYGQDFLQPFYDISRHRFEMSGAQHTATDVLLYSICLYRKDQERIFWGRFVEKLSLSFSVTEILQLPQIYKDHVIQLAETALNKIKPLLYPNGWDRGVLLCPHLGNRQILHGIVDLITRNKLVVCSCSGRITQEHCFRALAYHYLSTK